MKVSYVEGLATHNGPESCVGVREDEGKALTGERAGRVLSREIKYPAAQAAGTPGCRRRGGVRKAIPGAPPSQGVLGSRAVRDLEHVRKHLVREPGDPTSA
jgi:hypothetical protein